VSKSQYGNHSTKVDDMFVPAANYPIDNGARNPNQPRNHSPYSYFQNLIKPNAKRGRDCKASEYYFYVTPNKPNPRRQLNKVKKKNCFLISGESFKTMLGGESSKAIDDVFVPRVSAGDQQ
jgi:hypothetical protein